MNDKIIQRMERLKAMAEDAGSENEAMIAAKRLHSLLAKHNMSMLDLDRDQDPVGSSDLTEVSRPWSKIIALAVAELYFCKIYLCQIDKRKARFVFSGRQHNREFAMFVCTTLFKSINQQALRESRATYGKKSTPFINSFKNAAAGRISERCRELVAAGRAGTLEDEDGSNLPVLASLYDTERDAIQAFLDESGLNLKKGRATRLGATDSAGMAAGRQAGDRAQLSRALHGTNSPKQLGSS